MDEKFHKNQNSAFTLFEMLIALAIFSIVSLTAGTLLYQAVEAQRVSNQYGARMIDLERGISRLSRDLLQYVPRKVRDELGDFTDSLIITPDQIEFTRRGWSNPADHARSDLQRVRYSVEGDALQRHYWDVLDRAPEAEARTQHLAANVSWVNFEPITESQLLRGDTLVSVEDEGAPALGIRVTLHLAGIGELVRVIDLAEAPPEEQGGDNQPRRSEDDDTQAEVAEDDG